MHEGHRDRMRERIMLNGLDSLQPHEVLEYLLYHVIPRKDTNEIAHELLNKYGSISRVFTADIAGLKEVKDMTENAAMFLSSLPEVFKLYAADLQSAKTQVTTRGDVVRLLSPLFLGDKTEKFYILCLDAHNNVINLVKVATGIPAQVAVDTRKVVEISLNNKAVSVIISHNHPSGDTSPSHEDMELTRAITVALELVKIKLIDHFIFSDFGYYSFAEDGLTNLIGNDVNKFLKEGLKY